MTKKSKINQDTLIYKDKEDAKKAEENVREKKNIPAEYIPIKLDSIGKLSAPKVLHFRNYSMSETIKLSTSRDLDLYENLIQCLNDMCYEDFDCSELTEQDMKSILLSIYGTWYDQYIRGMEYYIDEDAKDLNNEKNVGKVNLHIQKDINTNPIPENFIEPICITIKDTTVGFKLSRFKDFIFVSEYLKEKFFDLERKFSDVAKKIKEESDDLTYTEVKEYNQYLRIRKEQFLDMLSVQNLVRFNDIELKTVEQRIDYYKKIPQNFWYALEKTLKTLKFGIDPEVTFTCPVTKKKLTRRFQFRLENFIPDNVHEELEEFEISFG